MKSINNLKVTVGPRLDGSGKFGFVAEWGNGAIGGDGKGYDTEAEAQIAADAFVAHWKENNERDEREKS